MAAEYFARIKPYNPKAGHKIKRYCVFGIQFRVERGWYPVDVDTARYLDTVRNDNNDPESKKAFDVVDEDGLRKIIEGERLARIKQERRSEAALFATDTRIEAKLAAKRVAERRVASKPIGHFEDSEEVDLVLDSQDESNAPKPALRVTDEAREDLALDPPDLDDLPEPPPNVWSDDESVEVSEAPAKETKGDDLTALTGVGDTNAKRLVESGLTTYSAIAEASSEKLKLILGSRAAAVQRQAKKLAG